MSIVLRKIRGQLVPLWQSRSTGFRAGGGQPTPSLVSLLSSPLVVGLMLLALIAFLAVWSFLHPALPADHSTFALAFAAPIIELRQKRATLSKKANDSLETVQKKAKAENRALTTEEIAEQDGFDAQLKAMDDEIALEMDELLPGQGLGNDRQLLGERMARRARRPKSRS